MDTQEVNLATFEERKLAAMQYIEQLPKPTETEIILSDLNNLIALAFLVLVCAFFLSLKLGA